MTRDYHKLTSDKEQLQELHNILSAQKDDWHSKLSNLNSNLLQTQSKYELVVEDKSKVDVEIEQLRVQILGLQQELNASHVKIQEYEIRLKQQQSLLTTPPPASVTLSPSIQPLPVPISNKENIQEKINNSIHEPMVGIGMISNMDVTSANSSSSNATTALPSSYLQSRLQALSAKISVYNQIQ